jgi:uncharacterized protein (UPF0332 family)
LGKARELLDEATTALGVGLTAGRAAYLAGFHAAQAFLSTQSDRVPKTHSGLRSEFVRRVKDEPRITELQRAFLGRAYEGNRRLRNRPHLPRHPRTGRQSH